VKVGETQHRQKAQIMSMQKYNKKAELLCKTAPPKAKTKAL
jgi:hypothetical protein